MLHTHPTTSSTPPSKPIVSQWTWIHPDLIKGGEFYNKSVHKLRSAIKHLGPKYEYLLEEGLKILAAHRINYGAEGPTHLTILWWEWSHLHWLELREGVSMRFMDIPKLGLVPNQDLKGP